MGIDSRPERARRRYWSTFVLCSVVAFAAAFVWASASADQGFFNLTPDATVTQKAGLAVMPFLFPGLIIAHVVAVARANRTPD